MPAEAMHDTLGQERHQTPLIVFIYIVAPVTIFKFTNGTRSCTVDCLVCGVLPAVVVDEPRPVFIRQPQTGQSTVHFKGYQPMHLNEPRIKPLPESEWNDDTKEILETLRRDGHVYNIFATLARHPQLLKRWLVFGGHVLGKSSLPAREREIAILRMGWLCKAEYEWGHHVAIGKQVGLNDDDIKRITEGPDAAGLDPFEATLLRAVDELHSDTFIGDSTWKALAERYSTEQVLDFLFTAGQYKLVSMVLNSAGVQLEEGFDGFSK